MKFWNCKYLASSFIIFNVVAVGTIGRVMLMSFNVAFCLSLVLSSDPPDEPQLVMKLEVTDKLERKEGARYNGD